MWECLFFSRGWACHHGHLFDDKTSLGLIRLQINKIIDELSKFFHPSFKKKDRNPVNHFGLLKEGKKL